MCLFSLTAREGHVGYLISHPPCSPLYVLSHWKLIPVLPLGKLLLSLQNPAVKNFLPLPQELLFVTDTCLWAGVMTHPLRSQAFQTEEAHAKTPVWKVFGEASLLRGTRAEVSQGDRAQAGAPQGRGTGTAHQLSLPGPLVPRATLVSDPQLFPVTNLRLMNLLVSKVGARNVGNVPGGPGTEPLGGDAGCCCGLATSFLLSRAMRGQWSSLAGNPKSTQGPCVKGRLLLWIRKMFRG